jgi:short-subunit dehydrogenase
MAEDKTKPTEFPLNPRPRAVIIGASSGIGEALARKLAFQGFFVALLARRKDALKTICEEINQAAGETRAVAYPHDVTEYEKVPELFQQILQDMQNINLFVFVSGVLHPVAPEEYNFEKDKEMIDVNLLGAMAWLGQAASFFNRMGAGHIVGVSSIAGDRGRVKNPGYQTSKAGLTTYLESLRNRLRRKGVYVLTVKPGFVQTEMLVGSSITFGAVTPQKAADDIWRAIRRRKNVLYTPWLWRWIMLTIQHIPSFIFRRLSF